MGLRDRLFKQSDKNKNEEDLSDFSLEKYNLKDGHAYIFCVEEDLFVGERVCRAFEENKIKCWIKSRDLSADGSVSDISRAIKDSLCFIFIYSKYIINSKLALTELDIAFSYDVPILCFNIDESKFSPDLEFILINSQRIDAYPRFEEKIPALLKSSSEFFIESVKSVPQSSGHDVFISYSTKDTEVARKICYVLEQNKVKCWIAPRDIAAGCNYIDQIADAIDSAKLHLLVYSEYAQKSQYVKNEIQTSFSKEKKIIAINIGDSFPKGDMEFYLKNTQMLNGYPNFEDSLEDLIRSVYRLLGISVNDSNNPDIFISYTSKDDVVAQKICHLLEENNIKCWIAPRDIPTGSNALSEIAKGINDSSLIVVIFSENFMESNFAANELKMAFNKEKAILAIKVDDSMPEGDMEFYLIPEIWIDAYPYPESVFETIVKDASILLDKPIDKIKLENDVNEGSSLFEKSLNLLSSEGDDSSKKIKRASSFKSFHASNDYALVGEGIVLSGKLESEDEGIEGANISIHYDDDIIDVISAENGEFSKYVSLDDVGSFSFKAVFDGNEDYENAESSNLTVLVKKHCSINLKSTSTDVKVGDPIILTGRLETAEGGIGGAKVHIFESEKTSDPKTQDLETEEETSNPKAQDLETEEETINLKAQVLDDENLIDTVFTSKNGEFSKLISADAEGTFSFKAVFDGNDDYGNVESSLLMVKVAEEGKIGEESGQDKGSTDDGEVDEPIHYDGYKNNLPFVAYDGDEPYIFISYKHSDYKLVYPVIKRLHDEGFNLWYDAALPKGKYYDIQIANHIKNAKLFITFFTQEVINCANDEEDYLIKELSVANMMKTERLAIFLEKVELDGFYLMHYLGKQWIIKHDYANDEFFIEECIRAFINDFGLKPKK